MPKDTVEAEIDELAEIVIEIAKNDEPSTVYQSVRYEIAKMLSFRLAKTEETAYNNGHEAGFHLGWKDGYSDGVEVERERIMTTIAIHRGNLRGEEDSNIILFDLQKALTTLPEVSL
jgi:flagellar biosynthesis/type III secretory pathway protein FliH